MKKKSNPTKCVNNFEYFWKIEIVSDFKNEFRNVHLSEVTKSGSVKILRASAQTGSRRKKSSQSKKIPNPTKNFKILK